MTADALREGVRADPALDAELRAVLARLSEGAALPREHAGIAALARRLHEGAAAPEIDRRLRELSHAGYLRGALVSLAAHLRLRPRVELVLVLARELCDALAPDLGVALGRALLALPEVDDTRWIVGGPAVAANILLGDTLLDRGEALAAQRHFEAVLAVDIDHPRALRGWSAAQQRLGRGAARASRGLALLEGLDALELTSLGVDRYELGRPLGRGRHAVVYQAFDRRVGREVAIKRLVAEGSDGRLLSARFFAEARTLARVRSPHVIALLDVQPAHRFVALSLCRGGNLRLAVRRRLVGPDDLPRLGPQIRSALRAVHAAGAVHRDVKPANILVREARPGSSVALADFGLALAEARPGAATHAGTLRYLAPELRSGGPRARATPASDIFSAGVVLLELALHPAPLAPVFDQASGQFDATEHVPRDLPDGWSAHLAAMLAADPAART